MPDQLTPLSLDRDELDRNYKAWIERIAANHGGAPTRINDQPWFTPMTKPLSECRVALVTTAGAHLSSQEPFHVETAAGDSSHRVIPDDVDLNDLRFTHTHYDTTSAEKDTNVVLPIERLHEFAADGRIGEASPIHVGMMGFNPDPAPIADSSGPAVAALLTDAEVDVALMVPG